MGQEDWIVPYPFRGGVARRNWDRFGAGANFGLVREAEGAGGLC